MVKGIRNVSIIGDTIIPNGLLLIEDGRLAYVGPENHCNPSLFRSVTHWIDGQGGYAAPGLVDIHVHGGGGRDIMEGSTEALKAMAIHSAAGGATAFLASTVTGSPTQTMAAARAAAAYTSTKGAALLGLHFEGPYLQMERKGAQSGSWIRPIDFGEMGRLYRILGHRWKLMTLAPELPQAKEAIEWLNTRDIAVAAGHSTASYEQAKDGFAWGIRQATHIFNGMNPMHHREPGLVAASMTFPGVYCQLIADGVHVHPGAIRLLYQAVGSEHIVLITDAVQAAGLSDGSYVLGDLAIDVRDGTAWLPDGTLAGSTLTMLDAVKNVRAVLGVDLPTAFAMGSRNPAMSIGVSDRGWLTTGTWADVLLLDQNLNLVETIVAGELA